MKNQTQRLMPIILLCIPYLIQFVASTCIESCLNCSASMTCLQCTSNVYITIASNPSKGCLPCQPSCKTCTTEFSQCTNCASSYYLNITNSKCMPCQVQFCQTCVQSIPDICTVCMTGYYLVSTTGECQSCTSYENAVTCRQSTILSCQPGYYVAGGQKCMSCSNNCLQCTSLTYCAACAIGYFGSTCTACNPSCLTCNRSSSCLTCRQGMFLNSSSLCSACSFASNPSCVGCDNTGRCVRCLSTHYLDNNRLCNILTQKQTILGCIQYASASNTAITCRMCDQGYYLTASGFSCIQCSLLCQNCTGLYSTSSCSLCQPEIAISIGGGVCSFTPKSSTSQKRKLYLTQWNFPSSFMNVGANLSFINQNCPSWQLSTKTRVLVGLISGYGITFRMKIVFSTPNISKIQSLRYNISFNNIVINQEYLQSNTSIQKSSLCSEPTSTSTSFQYTQIITGALPTDISTNQTTSNSNYFQLASLSNGLYLKISQAVISYSPCHSSCSLCSSDSKCLLCENTLMLLQQDKCVGKCSQFRYQHGNKCVYACPIGTFQNVFTEVWTCSSCSSSCLQCDSLTQCTACSSGFYLFGTSCISACPTEYFANPATSHCQPCQPPCLTCNSSTICLSCRYNYLFNNTCVSSANCPSQQYPNTNQMVCTKCRSPCQTCLSQDYCTSCSPNTGYLFNGRCLPDCPQNYIKNISTFKCNKCQPQCLSCKNTTDSCTKCMSGFLLDGRCLNSCPDGFYRNQADMSCMFCSYPCLTCRSQSICLTCVRGYILHEQLAICVLQNICLGMVGSFLSSRNYLTNSTTLSLSITMKYCTTCPKQCASCSSPLICTSCAPTHYLLNNTCLLACPYKFYNNKKLQICSLCSANCSTCQKQQTFCTSCQVNTQLNSINTCESSCLSKNLLATSCELCTFPCYQCQSMTTICISCVQGYFLNVDNYECLSQCYAGFYQDRISRQCLRCNSSCQTCSSASTQCTSCYASTYLSISNNNDKSGQCVKACPSSYFPAILSLSYRICKPCQQPCLTCSLKSTNCLSCVSGILNGNECVIQCPPSRYLLSSNNTCVACDMSCSNCFGGNSNECFTCKIGYYYVGQTTACVANCPSGYVAMNMAICQPCQFPCLECTNSITTCLSCWNSNSLSNSSTFNYLLHQNSCIRTCPPTTFQQNYSCVPCQMPCRECLSPSVCLSCSDAQYFLNNTCLSKCPLTHFPNPLTLTCISCQYPCKTCASQTSCLSCIDGILINSSCIITNECPISQYLQYDTNGGMCKNCSPQCEICQLQKDRCLLCANSSQVLFQFVCMNKCFDGYYQVIQIVDLGLDGLNQADVRTCSLCPFECMTCVSETKCTKCSVGFKFLQGQCLQQCPQQYYSVTYNITSNGASTVSQCKKCSSKCKACINSADNCISCNAGLYYYQFKCYENCNNGTYSQIQYDDDPNPLAPFNSGVCLTCIFPCKDCNSSQICLSCYNGYYLYRGLCVQACKKPNVILQYGESQACINSCPQNKKFVLDQNTAYRCSQTCTFPFILSSSGQQCLTNCPLNQYIDQHLQCRQSTNTSNNSQITQAEASLYVDANYNLKLSLQFTQPIAYYQSASFLQEGLLLYLHYDLLLQDTNFTSQSSKVSRLLLASQDQFISEMNQTFTTVQFRIRELNSNYILIQLNTMSLFPKASSISGKLSIQDPTYLRIAFTNQSNLFLRSKISTIPLQQSTYYTALPPYQAYPQQLSLPQLYAVFGQVYVVYLLIIGAILILFNQYGKIYQSLQFCQFLFLCAALEIQYPPNLWIFLQGFRNSHFYFIGNWFISNVNTNKVTESYPKIQSLFTDCNFIRICGHIFSLALICLALALTLFLIKQFKKLQNRIPQIFTCIITISHIAQSKLKIIKWSHAHDFAISTTMILLFGFFIQMHDYNTNSTLQIIGIISSYFVVGGIAAYFVYLTYKITRIIKLSVRNPKQFMQKKYMQRGNMISIVDRVIHPKELYLSCLRGYKILFFGSVIGIFSSSPMLCTGSFLSIKIISSLFYVFSKPYPDQLRNIILGCADLSSALSLFFISLIHFSTTDKASTSDYSDYIQTKWRLGWAAIIMIIISLFLLMAQFLISLAIGNTTAFKLSAEDPKKIPAPLLDKPPQILEVSPKKLLKAWEIGGEEEQQTAFGFQYQSKNV